MVLTGLWLFEGRSVTFMFECFVAEKELEKNFVDNEAAFFDLVPFLDRSTPIQFDFHSEDSIYMTFQDSAIYYSDLFIDSNYSIGPETKSEFRINKNGCLEIIEADTLEVCNHNWQIQFFGHYKDKRINQLLSYYGWTRKDFEPLVEKIRVLNCTGFSNGEKYFALSYKIVSYYDDGMLHCFGHSDGYFDYMYTAQPDSFRWQSSLNKLDGNYYGIEHWNFF